MEYGQHKSVKVVIRSEKDQKFWPFLFCHHFYNHYNGTEMVFSIIWR